MDRQISILIIDDDLGACETLSDILEDEGYKVLTLERGLQGIEQIKSRFFNVVLLDIILPDVSGLEVLRAIKKINSEVCVIMITGYAKLENAIEALNNGADAYINKPLNMDEVKLNIKRGVERQIILQEKKRLEQKVRETKEYLENILNNSADMIITTDIDTRIVEFNKGGEQMLGYKKEEVIGRHVEEFYLDKEERLRLMERVKREGSISVHETRFKRKDGSIVDISLTLSLLRNDSGEVIGTVGISKDITDMKSLEHQLLQSEKLAGIGILASGIAHEINNPLCGIRGMAEIILEEENMETIKEHTDNIIKYSDVAAEIVKELTGYVRTAEASDFESVNVNEKLNDAIKISKHSTRFEDVEIITDYQTIPLIRANSDEIQQVFVNLINNAVQAMNRKGRLVLSTMTSGDYVEIKVMDNGPGIPKGHINKIFDPFFTTKEVGKGKGLGLNIVYRIVTKYYGSIEAESEEGKGTTFTLRFPAENKK